MENQRMPPLSWAYCFQGKGIEELRHSLLCTTLELETTKLAAQEEFRRRDDELKQLKDLLNRAIRERDEANDKYQRLLLRIQQQQQQQQQQQIQQLDEGHGRRGDSNTGLSSSECEESIVSGSSPVQSIGMLEIEAATTATATTGMSPLPEKGKLLQAVMKAGPLLQTLLLAGPLPQWRHPPPPLDSLEIPPVTIPTSLNNSNGNQNITNLHDFSNTNSGRKRAVGMCQDSDDSSPLKYRRIVLH